MPDSPASVLVDFDQAVPMRDGTTLRANVYRPSGDGRWPVLLTRLPYGKDLPGGTSIIDPTQAARRGYVVIVQDTRGRFASEGDFVPFEGEGEDGVDTLAWAAGLPYADGQVGMYGASYFGFTQWSAAVHAPPALKAMVPFVTWCDPRNGVAYRGGALELGTMANWSLQMAFDQILRKLRQDPRALGAAMMSLVKDLDELGPHGYASVPLGEFAPLKRQPGGAMFFNRVGAPLDQQDLKSATIRGKHAQVKVPTLNVGGWFDIFLADTIENFLTMRQLGVPTKLLIGPWTHVARGNPVGEVNFGFASQLALINMQMDFGRLQLRWFDHWLKNVDTGMLQEPPIQLFVMGRNTWRTEQEWPLARAQNTPYYLRAGGELSPAAPAQDEASDCYVYDPADPVPTRGGATLMSPEFAPGPMDQREIEARPDVLTFTTPVLEHDMEVTGPVMVHLWACSSAPDTDFVARLCDVSPDGRSYNLTDGILRARYRENPRHGPEKMLEPNRPYELSIDLWATSNVFRAGHRIRLDVTSSSFPRWDRNPNTGAAPGDDAVTRPAQQTILHDASHPSRVVLPVVPA